MTLALAQSATAIGPARQVSFLAAGGTPPYIYSVTAGGAGGTIDMSTGVYMSPASAASAGARLYDTIQVTDSLAATATALLLVGLPLLLFCEVLQRELCLCNGRVYLWDQKLMQPTDAGLYVAVSVMSCKPFGSSNKSEVSGLDIVQVQSVNMLARVDVDIISRGPEARDRKEEVLLALNSTYMAQQQAASAFHVGRLPTNFIDLSGVDGAAIPYRYKISLNMQYAFVKTRATQYYDDFSDATLETEP